MSGQEPPASPISQEYKAKSDINNNNTAKVRTVRYPIKQYPQRRERVFFTHYTHNGTIKVLANFLALSPRKPPSGKVPDIPNRGY